jgi:membrane fusion protein (multidrug efflux system)
MNKYKNKSILLFGALALLSACGGRTSSDIDELKEKRAALKAEMVKLDLAIQALDTTNAIFVPLVETEKVFFGPFEHEITVQGEIVTDQEIMINSEAAGMIQTLPVREGQFVRKGQTLVEIDAQILQSNIKEIETAIEFAQYSYDKQVALMERGVGTEFELKQAKNQLESLKSQLNTVKTQKGKTVVQAPFDGYIDEIFVRRGEMAGAQSPILRLVNNEEMRLAASISEFYFTSINNETAIRAYIPTLQDTLKLNVTAVGNFIHPTNRTFRVQADIPREMAKSRRMLPNMLAEMHITDFTIDSAIVVPATALMKTQDNEDFIFLLVPKNGKNTVKEVMVNVISRHRGRAAISGVDYTFQNGDVVVTAGSRGVTTGDIVRIR